MKLKDMLKLLCIDCLAITLLFFCLDAIVRLQAFVTVEVSKNWMSDIFYTRAVQHLSAFIQISAHTVFALLFTFSIDKLVHCLPIRLLIATNSIIFLVAAILGNYILGELFRMNGLIYIFVPSSAAAVAVTQIALALLFVKKRSRPKPEAETAA